MTQPATPPPLGTIVVQGQLLGFLPGDDGTGLPSAHHLVAYMDPLSRRIRGQEVPRSGKGVPDRKLFDPRAGEVLVYWGQASRLNIIRSGEYLPYPPLDGISIPSSPEPVNPYGVGPKWQDILSRFAHDVMAFNPASNHLRDVSTHASGHLPPTDAAAMLKNKATYQLGRAVVGVAFHRIEKWMTLNALQLAQYPQTVTDSQNWKVWLEGEIPVNEGEIPFPNMGDMMAMICGDEVKDVAGLCVGAWVYLLNERIDASTYDSNMNSGGEIRLPNSEWDIWRPYKYLHRVNGTPSERSDEWAEIMGWFTQAHNHYLTSVAPAINHS